MNLLHSLIDAAAQRWPDRIAVSTKITSYTHQDLAEASWAVANWLQYLGLHRGQRLVIVGPTDAAIPVVVYAASRLGITFCLLHEQTKGEALAYILDDAEPALLIAAEEEALELGRHRGISAVSFQALREQIDAPSAKSAPMATDATISVDPLCLIYTSGTTSRPKAVVSTHDQALFSIHAIQKMLAYTPDDVVYCPLPLSFDYGMYQLFLGAVSGCHIRLGLPAEVGPSILSNLLEVNATVLASVPAIAENLARLLRRSTAMTPSTLRLLTNTGAAMPSEPLATLRKAIPGLRVQLMFGLTECKRAAIMPPDGDLERPGSCGIALPGTEIFTIDKDGNRAPPGTIGELVVRGPNVMAGYWRCPELTALRFHRQEGLFPQLRTGDQGWLDGDGYVFFIGRDDEIYKERGFRVSTIEVETAARKLAGVETAVVLPPNGGKPALLVVVGKLNAEDVKLMLRDEIEEFKIPATCVVLDELPLTNNGKVNRKALREVVTDV